MASRDCRRLAGQPLDAARWLLGATLTSTLGGETVTLRLTEVEAYGGMGFDPASHAHRRRTPRNAPMFGAPGTLYVYRCYGIHHLLNIAVDAEGVAGAVLLRAGRVVAGLDAVRARRGKAGLGPEARLASGPGNLAVGLGIVDVDLSGRPVLLGRPIASEPDGSEQPMSLRLPARRHPDPAAGPRIGIPTEGQHLPWRLWIAGEPSVSGSSKVRQDGAP